VMMMMMMLTGSSHPVATSTRFFGDFLSL